MWGDKEEETHSWARRARIVHTKTDSKRKELDGKVIAQGNMTTPPRGLKQEKVEARGDDG